MDPTLVIVIVTFSVLGIIIGVAALLNRGKQLRCPDCENTFNAPILEQKTLGFGWTLPYMGTIRCPKCGKNRSRRDYTKVHQTKETQ